MKIKVTYWEQSGAIRTVEVEAENVKDAIERLADDEQHPLAQVKTAEVVG